MTSSCPSCGSPVPPDSIFCNRCGRKLTEVPAQRPATEAQFAPVLRPSRRPSGATIGFALAAGAILLGCCIVVLAIPREPSTSSRIPRDTQGPSPTHTPKPISDIDFPGLRGQFPGLTDAQKRQLSQKVNGQRVEWTGWIVDVQASGRVSIDMDPPETPFSIPDVHFDIPREDVLRYGKGQKITFRGDIQLIQEFLGFTVELADVEIVR